MENELVFDKVKEQDPFTFFVISRTYNKNVVSITANLEEDKIINKTNPVNPYWIMYEKDISGKSMEALTIYENNGIMQPAFVSLLLHYYS